MDNLKNLLKTAVTFT